MPGLFRQRAVQGDDVALLKQLFQRNIGEVCVRQGIGVICHHIHAEAAADADKDLPDLAGADHTDGSAVKIESYQTVQGKVEITGAEVCLVNFPVQCQQQPHGEFCHGIGRIAGDTCHGNASGGCLPVNVVVAGTPQGDHFHAGFAQPVNNGFVQRVIYKGDHRTAALCQ